MHFTYGSYFFQASWGWFPVSDLSVNLAIYCLYHRKTGYQNTVCTVTYLNLHLSHYPPSLGGIINNSNVRGVLPREVAQAVKVPTTLEATELSRVM